MTAHQAVQRPKRKPRLPKPRQDIEYIPCPTAVPFDYAGALLNVYNDPILFQSLRDVDDLNLPGLGPQSQVELLFRLHVFLARFSAEQLLREAKVARVSRRWRLPVRPADEETSDEHSEPGITA